MHNYMSLYLQMYISNFCINDNPHISYVGWLHQYVGGNTGT